MKMDSDPQIFAQPASRLGSRLKIACVVNANAGNNHHHVRTTDRRLLRDSLRNLSGARYFETRGVDELDALFAEPDLQDCDLMLFAGGDGTFQSLLSALLQSDRSWNLPIVGLLPFGSANVICTSMYGKTSWLQALTHLNVWLARRSGNWPLLPRRLIRVQSVESNDRDQYGFVFGIGFMIDGVRYCHEHAYRIGYRREWAALMSLLRCFYALLRGDSKYARSHEVRIDTGERIRRGRISLILISTLEQFFLGIRPQWDDGSGDFNYIEVGAKPRRIMQALLGLTWGGSVPWMHSPGDYLSESLNAVDLDFDGQYMLDGEIMNNAGRLRVSVSEPLYFLNLGSA